MKTILGILVSLVIAAAGVHSQRGLMVHATQKLKETDVVYPFPEPKQLKELAIGYESALADMLWAKLLVEYGMHWSEKREFLIIPKYLDAILELEPGYAEVFKYADTLLVYRPLRGTDADARLARAYLERGTRERPFDPNTWKQYGQFIAFLARSFLTSQTEVEAWRAEGAKAMLRSVDLGGDASDAQAALSMLTRGGETKATIAALRRAYAITEDPAQREWIEANLNALEAKRERDDDERAIKNVERLWRSQAPYISRTAFLLTWPAPEVRACAGIGGTLRTEQQTRACARRWDALLPKDEGDWVKR
jgi:hypothetical protein